MNCQSEQSEKSSYRNTIKDSSLHLVSFRMTILIFALLFLSLHFFLACFYECPPATMRSILTFNTTHLQACQIIHLRQNKVDFVGIGG
jgi:hypothetical protein